MTNSNEIKSNSPIKENTIASASANSKQDQAKISDNNLNLNKQVCKSNIQTRSTRKTRNVNYIESNEKIQVKNNCTPNVGKRKVLSPNHKLTEYFSGLRVNECNTVSNDIERTTFKEKQANNCKEVEHNIHLSQPNKRSPRKKANSHTESTNHKVTEYFPVRRSERKYKKNINEEKQKELESKIVNEIEDGLKIVDFEDKGRGIVTTKEFYQGDFVIEYIGDLIDAHTAKQRELKYSKNKNIGCYMYYFKHRNTQYCIDATKESGKLGRLINHSRKGNLVSRIVEINKQPRLVLFAKKDIPADTEILYDYGDRSRESVRNHPWLNY